MNPRRFHRTKVSGTSAEMTDGNNMLQGMVKNVSNTGIEVSLEAELADPHAAKYRLRLSDEDQVYSIAAIPRWQKLDGEGNLVGMRICEAPRKWFSFVNSFSSSHPKNKLLISKRSPGSGDDSQTRRDTLHLNATEGMDASPCGH